MRFSKGKNKKMGDYFKEIKIKMDNEGNDFIHENPKMSRDKTLIKLNKVLTKLIDVENDKVDALRLVSMYIESSGRDINLPQLISFLKS